MRMMATTTTAATIPPKLSLMLMLCLLVVSSSSSYLLDKDTRDDCLEYVDNCSSISASKNKEVDKTFYLSCPITCSKHLHAMGGIGETTKDPDDYYYSQTVNVITGSAGGGSSVSNIPIEDFVEGYVTIFVMLPMKDGDNNSKSDSGMIQYYYELLHHIASIYKYSLQIFLQPIDFSKNAEKNEKKRKKNANNDIIHKYIKQHPNDNVKNLVLLETTTKQTIPTVINDFVLATKPMATGSPNIPNQMLDYEPRIIANDRVTLYVVSADTKFVEQLISPTFHILEERLLVYISQLTYGEL